MQITNDANEVVTSSRRLLIAIWLTYIVTVVFYLPNYGGEGLMLPFNIATWGMVGITLGVGLYQLGLNNKLRYNSITRWLLVFCTMLTVPVLYTNANVDEVSLRVVGLWLGFGLFILLQQFIVSPQAKERLLFAVLFAVCIQITLGYWQFVLFEEGNFMNYNTLVNRPSGLFQQPNVMASFLATGVAIAGYLLSSTQVLANKSIKYILLAVPVVSIPLIVVLVSRSGWLSTTFVVIAYFCFFLLKNNKSLSLKWLSASALGLVIGITLWNAHQSIDNSQKVERLSNVTARITLYKQAIDMIVEKPITGYGYGNFEPAYTQFTAIKHNNDKQYPMGLTPTSHPHNEILFWGVEGGLLPIMAIVLLVTLIARQIIITKNKAIPYLALLAPISLHSLVEYPFYHSSIHWLTLVILLFIVTSENKTAYSLPLSFSINKVSRIMALVLPTTLLFYCFNYLSDYRALINFKQVSKPDIRFLAKVEKSNLWDTSAAFHVFNSYLDLGLMRQYKPFIEAYTFWGHRVIQNKPRPGVYTNLILAYQGLDKHQQAEEIRKEAQFLLPSNDFSKVNYDLSKLESTAGNENN